MISTRFETMSLPPHEQFGAWRTWYSSLFDTAADRTEDQGFPAHSDTWSLRGLAISDGDAPAVTTARTKTLIRRNPVDHWVLTVYRRGTVAFRTSGEALAVEPNVPFVVSLADEMTATETDYSRVQFYLSRNAFSGIAALLDGFRTGSLQTPEGRLLADYMMLLARNVRDLPADDGPRLVPAVEAMVAACLAPSASRVANAREQVDFTLMERVRRTVRVHLRSPSLGPDRLCREAGTSRSQLYRLLEGEGGVAHYIQRQRLSESFVMLCDVSTALPIGRIAEMLCFADASSFSRAFRREFHMTPRDVRAASLAGLQPVPQPKEATPGRIRFFADCLNLP